MQQKYEKIILLFYNGTNALRKVLFHCHDSRDIR
jgi:hypothetical protein